MRQEINLSGAGWKVWLDSTAVWQNDVLHLPRTLELSKLASNAPSRGWDILYSEKGTPAKVPATFEELFGNGDQQWRYHGVGWFTRKISVPEEWKDKTVRLRVEKARLRMEIYVNEQLAGYDIVAETPYSTDISPILNPGQPGRIAIRITNPGGQRSWNDSPVTEWTNIKLCPDQGLGDDMLAWFSAICDEGRNLKGPATDYNYWTRCLQITSRRINGKYFEPGDTARFRIGLINENKIPAGMYQLDIRITDGMNQLTGYRMQKEVIVNGGEDYAQNFIDELPVIMEKSWTAGYITLNFSLLKDGKMVAEGKEQVLLKNRSSWNAFLAKHKIVTLNWKAAELALQEAGVIPLTFSPALKADCILAGKVMNEDTIKLVLKQVKAGATLIMKFDSTWAELLYNQKILKSRVIDWGGVQKPYWNGNGWGYIDLLGQKNAVPSGYTIGTNSWEAHSDPVGFEPFESNYPQKSHGAFFFRSGHLYTLLGEIAFGKGKILLAPSYPVDDKEAFNDMIFFDLMRNSKNS